MSKEERLNVVGLPTSASSDVPADVPIRPRGGADPPAQQLAPATEEGDSLRQYLDVIARHKVVVLLCTILTPLIAFAYSLGQEAKFEASAAVLVNTGGAGAILSEIPGIATTADPERLAATHVSLARLPVVARNTVEAVGVPESAQTFLGRSAVVVDMDTDILRFMVFDSDPERAEVLATAYAQQFTRYRNGLDLQARPWRSSRLAGKADRPCTPSWAARSSGSMLRRQFGARQRL
jgi:uncharacterized protein involved in exopolysaccharide biosynthesis